MIDFLLLMWGLLTFALARKYSPQRKQWSLEKLKNF